uniref:Putative ovule protein n=1 Tax=Solanum chacoense TaxID=4108 RepID=A0A0V0GYW1_SOLCH
MCVCGIFITGKLMSEFLLLFKSLMNSTFSLNMKRFVYYLYALKVVCSSGFEFIPHLRVFMFWIVRYCVI